MVPKNFHNSKTAKTDSKVTNTREFLLFMGVLRYQNTFSLFLIFRSIIRINSRIGRNKNRDFQFYFFSICQITTSVGL